MNDAPAILTTGSDYDCYTRGVECRNTGRFSEAFDWFVRVSPTSIYAAKASDLNVTILLASGEVEDAVVFGERALWQVACPTVGLAREVARALRHQNRPADSLALCRKWLPQASTYHEFWILNDAACYATCCGEWVPVLDYLFDWTRRDPFWEGSDTFTDYDLLPLWEHLRSDKLSRWEQRWTPKFGPVVKL